MDWFSLENSDSVQLNHFAGTHSFCWNPWQTPVWQLGRLGLPAGLWGCPLLGVAESMVWCDFCLRYLASWLCSLEFLKCSISFSKKKKDFDHFCSMEKFKFMNIFPIWGKHLFIGREICYWKPVLSEPQKQRGLAASAISWQILQIPYIALSASCVLVTIV